MKRIFLTYFFVCLVLPCLCFKLFAQNISNFKQLSGQKLFDTANYYFEKNNIDTALIYYSLLINSTTKNASIEDKKRLVEVYDRSATLYGHLYDYNTSYDFLIRALILSEETHYESYQSKIYGNMGNIYFAFNRYDMAKLYYLKALELCLDSVVFVGILNNLGNVENRRKEFDSAFYFLNKAQQISKQHKDIHLHSIENNLAVIYQNRKQYDSAIYYYRLALIGSKKNGKVINEAANLLNLGNLFFEMNFVDSALYYINLSSAKAIKNNFLGILSNNYLTLSQIEEAKGHKTEALEYYKKYANFRDSVINTDKLGDINQLQRLYEVSKTNRQIEELAIEQRIKERTIYYQQIVLAVLLLISGILLYVFFQRRRLNVAYTTLVEKNVEIIDFQNTPSEKYKKSALTQNMEDELLGKILTIMDNTSIICDPEFSIGKLAELVQSNQKYVSQVINKILRKNFRTFLNSYRVREAQRLLSEPNIAKYTVESVAPLVGFKSRSVFFDAFKEITGVNPTFYIKSIRGK